MLVCAVGGKPGYLEKNPQNRDENQQQTQPTYDAESRNRTGPHWWEDNALPLCHPCSSLLLFKLLYFFALQVMPGLLLCFVMRYDNYKKHALAATDVEQSKITYFHCSLIGYVIGKNL